MRSLVAETRNNPAAREGLRKAVVDHMDLFGQARPQSIPVQPISTLAINQLALGC